MASFHQKQPSYFVSAGGSLASEGMRFHLLESREVWEGHAAMKGAHTCLLEAVKDSLTTTLTYIQINLNPGPLRNLAQFLAKESQDWLTAVIAHVNTELLTLSQNGIPEKEAYILVSDEI